VTILDDTARTLFVGEIFSGPASRTYAVGPLAAGIYRFRCDVHLEMSGTVIAR
jgi:plastocyanin